MNKEDKSGVGLSAEDIERLVIMAEDMRQNREGNNGAPKAWNFSNFANNKLIRNSGLFTPQSINDMIKRINDTPKKPTPSKIEKMYTSPQGDDLVSYSNYFELSDMPYKRALIFYGNLLSYSLEVPCSNIEKGSYSDNKFERDELIVKEILRKFNYRHQLQKITMQMLRQELYFGVLREDVLNDKLVFQELPREYCEMDGNWSMGKVFSFNMSWFLDHNVDVEMYPEVLQKKFIELFTDNEGHTYDPAMKTYERDGKYSTWVEVRPEDGFYCFKFEEERATEAPLFSPMFKDLSKNSLLQGLQDNKYAIDASQILVGLIGTNNGKNSTSARTDDLVISPEMALRFEDLVTEALGEHINFTSAPFEDVKSFNGDVSDKNIYKQYKSATMSTMGGSNRIIYAEDKLNSVESNQALEMDEMMMESIYPQFANFMEFLINNRTKKYNFAPIFTGTKTSSNKKRRRDEAKEDREAGMLDIYRQASARDLNHFEFIDRLKYGKAIGFEDLFTIVATANTISGSDGTNKKDDDELSEAGQQTRQDGGNIDKGGNS